MKNTTAVGVERLERRLAALLSYGSVLACLLVGVGLVLVAAGWHAAGFGSRAWSGLDVVTIGIALFILLPVSRVLLMLLQYLRVRDYRYAAIAATVLLIIVLGCVAGLTLGNAGW